MIVFGDIFVVFSYSIMSVSLALNDSHLQLMIN